MLSNVISVRMGEQRKIEAGGGCGCGEEASEGICIRSAYGNTLVPRKTNRQKNTHGSGVVRSAEDCLPLVVPFVV